MGKKKENEWYKQCDFIQEKMQFYSMNDFINNFTIIKKRYDKMTSTGKKLYQWYIYAKPYLSIENKKNVWDMLNLINYTSYKEENFEEYDEEE